MTNPEIQKLIQEISTRLNAEAEELLILATLVNQLSASSSNNEALLEATRSDEAREASNRLLAAVVQHFRNYRKYAATKGRWALDPLSTDERWA